MNDPDRLGEPGPPTDPVAASTVVLRDGTEVSVVPMQATDSERLMRFHETLSSETTYSRFFSFHPELSTKELHRFTHVDHDDREAIVGLADDEIIAVARFVADTLPHNQRMLAVFRHANLSITERTSEGVVHLTLEIPPTD